MGRVGTAGPAATVVVVRAAAPGRGLEVLVLRRSAEAGFVPGFVVFPGGSIEPGDRELAATWFGTPDEEARACALRKLAEEAGLVARPRADQMPQIGRWIAPTFLPVRFDARLFALAAGRDASPTPDGVEVDRAWWAFPADLLRDHAAGEIPLAWPTLNTLVALSGCATVADALGLHVEQVAPPLAAPSGSPPAR
jgi:8-oxo-dGTP pyrophosphatase MutT (NUDIX family)